jgi:hypothetical protein
MSVNPNQTDSPVFACDLNAIPAGQREQHLTTIQHLFNAVDAVQELDNGYALRLPLEMSMLVQAAEFIANERLCCPFFGSGLEIEPAGTSLWLRLTGVKGVKAFIMAEVGDHIDPSVLRALQK